MKTNFKWAFVAISCLAMASLCGCKDDEEKDDSEQKQQVSPTPEGDKAATIVKTLCSTVWVEKRGEGESEFYAYEVASQDASYYYLNEYELYYGGYSSWGQKSLMKISKRDPSFMTDAESPSTSQTMKYYQYANTDFKMENGWFIRRPWFVDEEAVYQTYRGRMRFENITNQRMELYAVKDYGSNIFGEIKRFAADYNLNVYCPETPKLLNMILRNGKYLYLGAKDEKYYYLISGGSFDNGGFELIYGEAYSIKDNKVYRLYDKAEIDEYSNSERYDEFTAGDIKAGDVVSFTDIYCDGPIECYVCKKAEVQSYSIVSDTEGEYLRDIYNHPYVRIATKDISLDDVKNMCNSANN